MTLKRRLAAAREGGRLSLVHREWRRYYEAAGDEPRQTLLFALSQFGPPGFAVDLGCGSGRDTVELLRRGWHVLAIDAEPEAVQRLWERQDLGWAADQRLQTQIARFEQATWPEADLINASFALPFCPPDAFSLLWAQIAGSLRGDGRFSGQLFGDRDGWASEPDMSFQTRREAEDLLRPFDVELFNEIEEDGTTVVGDPKHWHVFHIVARKY